MAHFKVHGATTRDDNLHLCRTCRNGQVTESSRGDMLTLCGNYGQRMIPFLVNKCTDYDDKTQPAEYDMSKIAWRVCSDKKNVVGLIDPKTWRQQNKDNDDY